MIPSLESLTEKALIGNDAGWLLAFYRSNSLDEPILEIGRDHYYGEIQATLPSGLEGGVYSFSIEGLTEEHYEKISLNEPNPPKVLRLYLFWRDTNSTVGGYLKNLAGLTDTFSSVKAKDLKDFLVADLWVKSVTRKAGERRYEATITAQERIFERLWVRVPKAIEPAPYPDAIESLLMNVCGMEEPEDFKLHGLPPKEKCGFDAGKMVRAQLLEPVSGRLEEFSDKYGRGMFLIRKGKLHVGPRPIPLEEDGGQPKKLTLGGGLIETEVLEPVERDPNFDKAMGDKPTRRQFRLTLKGRPDLFPGMLVEFEPPPEDEQPKSGGLLGAVGDFGALLPSLGGESSSKGVKLYVNSVAHKLGRKTGFVTILTGIEVKGLASNDIWDKHSPKSNNQDTSKKTASASPEVDAAKVVKLIARQVLSDRRFPEIAEIRSVHEKGTDEPPGQTTDAWCGLVPGKGEPHQSRRMAIERPSPEPKEGIAYATPFAWGKTGLVLPRYPGTRVLVAYRGGMADDPVDVGAVWESGKGPESMPGDWWLILPIGVPEQQRSTLAKEKVPEEHTGKVTQDLIDADGNRVIHVGELTICVAAKDKLKDAGQRPDRATHLDGGASIVIKSDGSVVIKAKTISFEAENDINMKAANVKVSVSGTMDVS